MSSRAVQTGPAVTQTQPARDLALLFLVVVGCAIPFLGQPFHIDDNFYMDMARNARVKPLFPNDTPYVFMGQSLPDMGSHSHPPLQTYFLALMQVAAGEGPGREWIYHSAALVFPLTAVVSLYFLAGRFVSRPLWPAIALAACPLFLVSQHTLMTDVPALAWWLAAAACFLGAGDAGRRSLYAASAAFQFAAMFTSYQSAAISPLLAFWHWRRGGKTEGWLWLAAPPLLMAAWFSLQYAHYGRFVLIDTAGYVGSRGAATLAALSTKLAAALQYQGWLIVFPLFLLFGFARAWRGRALALAALAVAAGIQLTAPDYRPADRFVLGLGLVTGTFVAIRFLRLRAGSGPLFARAGERSRDSEALLVAWYGGVFCYCVLLFTEGSARYILPLVPPVLIVFFRDLERAEVVEYREPPRFLPGSAVAASGSVVLSLAWGLLLSQADFGHARVYPAAAFDVARLTGRAPLWFGGEWGFRYYLGRAGARQLPGDETRVRGGDWIALPKLALPYDLPPGLRSMTLPVHTFSYGTATPLRLLDLRSPAGFYSTGWGMLPFSYSRRGIEEVDVFQVNFLVGRLPEAELRPSGEMPFPRYVEIGGRRALGLVLCPGSTLAYPWEFGDAVEFEVLCGLESPGLPRERRLFLRQVDGAGIVRAEDRVDLRGGLPPGERASWRALKLRTAGEGRLELSVAAAEQGGACDAVFADPIVRRVDR